MAQQRFADEVRRTTARGAEAEVDAGLAEIDRIELRVRVREVQHANVAERRDRIVERRAVGATLRLRADRQSRRGGGRDHVQELAAIHVASGVGRRGQRRVASSAATGSATC